MKVIEIPQIKSDQEGIIRSSGALVCVAETFLLIKRSSGAKAERIMMEYASPEYSGGVSY